MLFTYIFVIIIVKCVCEDSDLGYGLNIGNAIDVFANYGDLSQVTQVVSADYEEDDIQEPTEPFKEKNIRVFENVTSRQFGGDLILNLNIQLCETFDHLLDVYFRNFTIEGTDQPWKAFMGDWIPSEIMRTFGIGYDLHSEDCCFVLVRLTKASKAVYVEELTNATVKEYVARAVEDLNVSDTAEVRKFMRSYGTHYIESYVTGNFIYQVFKYKRMGFNMLKAYLRKLENLSTSSDNLRFYFSSLFLRQVGDIRIASGNKTVETWARRNLKDSQYLYSRPSLLKLHYNPTLAYQLNDLMDTNALLSLGLKTLRPLFKDRYKSERYAEVVENDMLLWEINA